MSRFSSAKIFDKISSNAQKFVKTGLRSIVRKPPNHTATRLHCLFGSRRASLRCCPAFSSARLLFLQGLMARERYLYGSVTAPFANRPRGAAECRHTSTTRPRPPMALCHPLQKLLHTGLPFPSRIGQIRKTHPTHSVYPAGVYRNYTSKQRNLIRVSIT